MNIFLCAENNCHSMSVAKKKKQICTTEYPRFHIGRPVHCSFSTERWQENAEGLWKKACLSESGIRGRFWLLDHRYLVRENKESNACNAAACISWVTYYARWLEGGRITVDLQNVREAFQRVVQKCAVINSHPSAALGLKCRGRNKKTWMEDQSVKLMCRLAFLVSLRGWEPLKSKVGPLGSCWLSQVKARLFMALFCLI